MKKKNIVTKKAKEIATKKNVIKAAKSTGEVIKSTGSFIAENKKEVLYVAGALLIGFVSYKVYKGISKGANGISEAFTDKSESVAIDVNVNNTKTSISNKDAQKFAQQLLDACNEESPFYGTDEAAVEKVFLKLNTGDDFKLVYEAFGKKNYNGNGSPPVGFMKVLDNYSPRDLVFWLKAELSPSDGNVYKIVKERIESAGWIF